MYFLDKKEKQLTDKFLKNGYVIKKAENKSYNYILNTLTKGISKTLKIKKKIDLNYLHKIVDLDELNNFRLKLIHFINKDKFFRFHYFNLARKSLYVLAGNELMMQKNINLSIQFPNDTSSLLPIHSDVWSGDSAYELNLWVPLVNCYKTKSMYILNPKDNYNFNKEVKKNKKIVSSKQIFNKLKKKLEWLTINKGNFLIFDQTLPHGNVVNKESQTRVSMNCRFKSIFSPYGDKKIGEFFTPITPRASSKIGRDFKFPF